MEDPLSAAPSSPQSDASWATASDDGDGVPPLAPLPPAADLAALRAVTRLTVTRPDGSTADTFLVGTAHVSPASCADAAAAVAALRPRVVVLELCSQRKGMLLTPDARATAKKSLPEALAEWRAGRASLLLAIYAWMLSAASDAMGGAAVGSEFRAAAEAAEGVGARIILGDRPVSVTVARTWAALSPWDRTRFLWEMVVTGCTLDPDALARMMADLDGDAVTAAVLEMGKAFPTLLRPLLYERDEYMAYVLRSLAVEGGVERAVAVVGAGHVKGIVAAWGADIDIAAIAAMPPPRRRSPWLTLGLVVGGGAAVAVVALRARARAKG
jgi:pheromone shutdown protein TraB